MTMTEDQFLKTMIETIKYDDYEKKEEMPLPQDLGNAGRISILEFLFPF